MNKQPQKLFINNFLAFSPAKPLSSEITQQEFTLYPIAKLGMLLATHSPNQELQIDYLMEGNFQTWFSKSDLITSYKLNNSNCIIAGRIEFDENRRIKAINHDSNTFVSEFDNLKFILAFLLIHNVAFAEEIWITESDLDSETCHLVKYDDLNTWQDEKAGQEPLFSYDFIQAMRNQVKKEKPIQTYYSHRLHVSAPVYPEELDTQNINTLNHK